MKIGGPSTHLTWKELACKDGTPYPEDFILDGRIFRLSAAFEDVRAICGNNPIQIYSAYRTPEWNKKVGGAAKSQHLEGRALDLHHTKLKNYEFYEIIRGVAWDIGIHGIGYYRNFVHIDTRPTSKLVSWESMLPKESRT